MAYRMLPDIFVQLEDANGNVAAGHTLEFYIYNTSTPVALYTNASGTSLGTSCTLNSLGSPQTSGGTACQLFGDTTQTAGYKIVQKDTFGSVVKTIEGPIYVEGIYAATLMEARFPKTAFVESFTALKAATLTGYRTIFMQSFSLDSGKGGCWLYLNGTTGSASTGDHPGACYDAAGNGITFTRGQPLYAEMFGALGDNTTSDSTVINTAVAWCSSGGVYNYGLDLNFYGESRYRLTAPILMKALVRMRGNGCYFNCDWDGPAFVGGLVTSYNTDQQFLHLEHCYIYGSSPAARTAQHLVHWQNVYVDSHLENVVCINAGGDSFRMNTVNAVSMNKCWGNIAGGRNLRLINCSAFTVNGGAFEGPGVTNFTSIAYAVGSRAISIENTVYGDYAVTLNGVQTERSSIGVYADYSKGLRILGLNAHNTGGPTSQAMIYLTANTDNTVCLGITGESYSTVVDDQKGGVTLTTSGDATNYIQGIQNHAAASGSSALAVLSGNALFAKIMGLSSAGGFVIQEASNLADDTVYTFQAVGTNNRALYILAFQDYPNTWAIFTANGTGATVTAVSGSDVAHGSAVLTNGTGDGTDARLNIFPASGTTIGIKNRMGATSTWTLYSFATS